MIVVLVCFLSMVLFGLIRESLSVLIDLVFELLMMLMMILVVVIFFVNVVVVGVGLVKFVMLVVLFVI